MTNRRLAVAAVIVLFLAIAVNTYLVFRLLENGQSHHADTSMKIAHLEGQIRTITKGGSK